MTEILDSYHNMRESFGELADEIELTPLQKKVTTNIVSALYWPAVGIMSVILLPQFAWNEYKNSKK